MNATVTHAVRPNVERSHVTPSLLTHAAVFARRNVEHIRQVPERLFEVTLQPLMFVLLFTYVFGGAIAIEGGSYREFLIGGILVQSLAFGLVGPAIAIANDMNDGMIDRFRSLPTSSSAYLAGHYLAQFAGAVVSIVISVVAGVVVGWRTDNDVASVIGAFVLLVVFATAMIWVGTWLGLSVRSPDAVLGMAFVVIFPLTFLSNAFVPIETLPGALQWFASWNPVSVITSGVRTLFGNPVTPVVKPSWPLEHPVLASFLACALLLVVSVPMAQRRYRARTRH